MFSLWAWCSLWFADSSTCRFRSSAHPSHWLEVLRVDADGTADWIGDGTVSVRLYLANVVLSACAFVMALFRSATAFGSCAFTSLYARVVWSPTTMPPIRPFLA